MKIIVKEPAVYMVRAMFLSHLYYYRNSGVKRTEWWALLLEHLEYSSIQHNEKKT